MVSAFAVSTGGKLGALLAGSCSPTSPSSPSSYYLLHVPEISSMKQGHWQESHTYFFCTSSQSSAAWKWLVVFFSSCDMAWLIPLKSSLLFMEGGCECTLWLLFCLHGSILHSQNNSAQLTASFECWRVLRHYLVPCAKPVTANKCL